MSAITFRYIDGIQHEAFLYECSACSAVVTSPAAHRQWHSLHESGTTPKTAGHPDAP